MAAVKTYSIDRNSIDKKAFLISSADIEAFAIELLILLSEVLYNSTNSDLCE